ncbi:MAG TPA: HEAT repeat domain-containing protein, partial [Longimicrobiales bacterium]|nr:HEAT repeat domain-containing protein [Longimicrobiales bacterium]
MTDSQDRKAVGVFTTDAKLAILSWDVWMARASGISEVTARGRHLFELFPEIESRGLGERLQSVISAGTVDVLAPAFHHYLIKCPTAEGAEFFDVMQQHVTLSPLREHGDIRGLVVTIEDVTARCVRERRLAEQLKSEDEAIRLRATRQLTESREASDSLVHALGDKSWQVRRTAASGIAETRNTDAIARLVDIVRDRHTDLATLNASLSALTLAKRDSMPLMIGLLDNPDANVRMYTALALGNMQDTRALPDLLPLLKDPDLNVRY